MRFTLLISLCAASLWGVGGLFISSRLLVPSGGAVVLAMSTLFVATLALSGLRTLLRRAVRA